MDLSEQIMSLPINTGLAMVNASDRELIAYKIGHRDARHAAAELALKADATMKETANIIEEPCMRQPTIVRQSGEYWGGSG